MNYLNTKSYSLENSSNPSNFQNGARVMHMHFNRTHAKPFATVSVIILVVAVGLFLFTDAHTALYRAIVPTAEMKAFRKTLAELPLPKPYHQTRLDIGCRTTYGLFGAGIDCMREIDASYTDNANYQILENYLLSHGWRGRSTDESSDGVKYFDFRFAKVNAFQGHPICITGEGYGASYVNRYFSQNGNPIRLKFTIYGPTRSCGPQ